MKTSMQELKDKIQHAIEELNGQLNDYKAGYKQCLINIQNDIDFQMLQMEKEQILESYKHGQNNGYMYRDGNSNIIQAEQYYNETFNKSIKNKG